MHDFLKRPKRHHVKEIPLAPILDLLVVVIFFLILSASFTEIRQNLIPPSSTVVSTSAPLEQQEIPLNPKLLVVPKDNGLFLLLKWEGKKPGVKIEKIPFDSQLNEYNQNLITAVRSLVQDLKVNYPEEKAMQIGWQGQVRYQTVLNVVDGVMLKFKDIVFLSPEDTEIIFQKSI